MFITFKNLTSAKGWPIIWSYEIQNPTVLKAKLYFEDRNKAVQPYNVGATESVARHLRTIIDIKNLDDIQVEGNEITITNLDVDELRKLFGPSISGEHIDEFIKDLNDSEADTYNEAKHEYSAPFHEGSIVFLCKATSARKKEKRNEKRNDDIWKLTQQLKNLRNEKKAEDPAMEDQSSEEENEDDTTLESEDRVMEKVERRAMVLIKKIAKDNPGYTLTMVGKLKTDERKSFKCTFGTEGNPDEDAETTLNRAKVKKLRTIMSRYKFVDFKLYHKLTSEVAEQKDDVSSEDKLLSGPNSPPSNSNSSSSKQPSQSSHSMGLVSMSDSDSKDASGKDEKRAPKGRKIVLSKRRDEGGKGKGKEGGKGKSKEALDKIKKSAQENVKNYPKQKKKPSFYYGDPPASPVQEDESDYDEGDYDDNYSSDNDAADEKGASLSSLLIGSLSGSDLINPNLNPNMSAGYLPPAPQTVPNVPLPSNVEFLKQQQPPLLPIGSKIGRRGIGKEHFGSRTVRTTLGSHPPQQPSMLQSHSDQSSSSSSSSWQQPISQTPLLDRNAIPSLPFSAPGILQSGGISQQFTPAVVPIVSPAVNSLADTKQDTKPQSSSKKRSRSEDQKNQGEGDLRGGKQARTSSMAQPMPPPPFIPDYLDHSLSNVPYSNNTPPNTQNFSSASQPSSYLTYQSGNPSQITQQAFFTQPSPGVPQAMGDASLGAQNVNNANSSAVPMDTSDGSMSNVTGQLNSFKMHSQG